jgi:hypothetical protein
MSTHDILALLTGFVGFVLAIALTAGVILLVRKPIIRILQYLVGDETVARSGAIFALILLGLQGLTVALNYITQENLSRLFGGLTGLLDGLAGVIQWVVYIAALLFIGYSLRGWKKPSDTEQK